MTGISSLLAMAGGSAAAPPSPLTASAAPTTETWTYDGGLGYYVSGDVTATPSGGTTPYTYAWERVSGYVAAGAIGPTSAVTPFVSLFGTTTVFKCLVTDSLGVTAYTNNVSIS